MLGNFEVRVCDVDTLLLLCRSAEKYEFNRQVHMGWLDGRIDKDKLVVLQMIIEYHRASFGPTQEPVWPDHHRCMVYAGSPNQEEPIEFQLDVEASKWSNLMTVDEFNEAVNDPIRMGVALARSMREVEEV